MHTILRTPKKIRYYTRLGRLVILKQRVGGAKRPVPIARIVLLDTVLTRLCPNYILKHTVNAVNPTIVTCPCSIVWSCAKFGHNGRITAIACIRRLWPFRGATPSIKAPCYGPSARKSSTLTPKCSAARASTLSAVTIGKLSLTAIAMCNASSISKLVANPAIISFARR